jgi:hypothetical protein
MADADPPESRLIAKLVVVAAIVLLIVGLIWHGVNLPRFWHDLVDRSTGPMKFRFIMQPLMAAIFAIRDGLKYARTGRSPYLTMMVLRDPRQHIGRLIEGLNVGLNATARIIALAFLLDTIYQLLVLGTLYPFEALIVALLLGYVPYLIIRVLVVHAWRRVASMHAAR